MAFLVVSEWLNLALGPAAILPVGALPWILECSAYVLQLPGSSRVSFSRPGLSRSGSLSLNPCSVTALGISFPALCSK